MSIHPGSIWIDQNWNRLPDGFWIAARGTGVVSEHTTYSGLIANIANRRVPLSDVTIIYIPHGVVQ
jgi:hypothetical protein